VGSPAESFSENYVRAGERGNRKEDDLRRHVETARVARESGMFDRVFDGSESIEE
jgi:hypothetical protein